MAPRGTQRPLAIDVGIPPVGLPGTLSVPGNSQAVVIFAHGSGSSRLSPRNMAVADVLHEAGLATLLFDLLTPDEARYRENVFDITLLAERLVSALEHARARPETRDLPVGLFGASTGAAAALVAAALLPREVAAVVSRGGRPDLAGDKLPLVRAPTLLIVGGDDTQVLALNRAAKARMRCETRLAVVPGATHLFEEPGTLDEAARLAAEWFLQHTGRS